MFAARQTITRVCQVDSIMSWIFMNEHDISCILFMPVTNAAERRESACADDYEACAQALYL